ncbi:MAG TPA: OmpH family outer membrane protein [Thermotoga sp.]|nr:OmpH family outer membrane protein [Thermotoga sp.]
MKMIPIFMILGVFLVTVLISQNPQENLRIAYVDIAKVTENYKKMQELNERYKKDYQFYLSKLKEMESEIEKMKEEGAPESEIVAKQKELLSRKSEYESLLKKEYEPKIQEILNEVATKIKEYAQLMGYSLILNKQSVIYGDEIYDITNQVIAYINSGENEK